MDDDRLAPGSIRAEGLGRRFVLRSSGVERSLVDTILRRDGAERRDLWALRDVDLAVEPGQAFGIVGRNGSGKSTLLKLIAGIYAPSEGTIRSSGQVGSLLEVGAGFHPEFTGVENVFLSAAVHGIPRAEIAPRLDAIIDFAELRGFEHASVKTYSSGMFTRLGFSVAMEMHPRILLLDEILAVGDAAFQAKCFARVWEYRRAGGTLVFVSHNASSIEQLCDQAILLDHGRVIEAGSPQDVLRTYHRRLTRATASDPASRSGGRVGGCRIVTLRAKAGDGAYRSRFIEGEPAMIELGLVSDEGADGLHVTLRFRDHRGGEIGARTLRNVTLEPGIATPLRLHLPHLPLREGTMGIDVVVTATRGTVLDEPRVLELSAIAESVDSSGAVAIGGAWEWPPERPLADAPQTLTNG